MQTNLWILDLKKRVKLESLLEKDDLLIPEKKIEFLNETEKKVKNYEKQYSEGLITRGEKYNKVVDAWAKCTDTCC